MKTLFRNLTVTAFCFVASVFTASADNNKPIAFEQLPQQAQQFVKTHFADVKVTLSTVESGLIEKTYEMFDTGVTGQSSPNNGAAANFVMAGNKSMNPVAARYVLTESKDNVDMVVRFRNVDGTYGVATETPTNKKPGGGAVRIFGYDQTSLAGDPSIVQGPKIYIK